MNQPITETMKISDVRSNLNTLVNEVYRHEKRVIVEKSGIPVAAVISMRDLENFEFLKRRRAERFKIIEEMQSKFADVPVEEIERMAQQTVAEARAELRSKGQQRESQE
jgi:prevent-host-death family protein